MFYLCILRPPPLLLPGISLLTAELYCSTAGPPLQQGVKCPELQSYARSGAAECRAELGPVSVATKHHFLPIIAGQLNYFGYNLILSRNRAG